MVNILVIAGIIFIFLAFRKGRMEAVQEQQELQELKQVRDELTEAKKEVGSLLEQLEVVTEKVVEEISAKVEEVKLLETAEDTADGVAVNYQPQAGIVDEVMDEELDNEEEPDFYEDEFSDELNDGEPDEGEPAAEDTVKKAKHKPSVSEENFRSSIDRLKQKSGSTKSGKGKTIIFPRRQPEAPETEGDRRDAPQQEREIPPKHQMVYAMAKLGYSEEEIAKQMKMGKGEVSLMLQLKRKGEEANG